uniref:Pantothenate kinase n=1 Tax=Lotharella oceanica TaxID=641309 RepID=A0A7S2X606_9EUKA
MGAVLGYAYHASSSQGKSDEDEDEDKFSSYSQTRIYRRASAPSECLEELVIPSFPKSGVVIGMDIGGTLAKIAICFSPQQTKMASKLKAFLDSQDRYGETGRRDKKYDFQLEDGAAVVFVKFESSRTLDGIELIKQNKLISVQTSVACTGGGAVKFNSAFQNQLRLGWHEVDEMQALVSGITFLIQHVPKSIFAFDHSSEDAVATKKYLKVGEGSRYPCLLVNVGSGVSILHLESRTKYRRVGGSSSGGATFFGLAKIISECKTWKEALDLARNGDSKKVDLLVGDIYGGHYTKLGLKADTIAAYFGKLARIDREQVTKEDLMAALLKLITYTIGNTAFLYARIYAPKDVIFTGNFLRDNDLAKSKINFMVRRLSEGKINTLFMEREGYYGALGAMLHAKHPKEEDCPRSRDSGDAKSPVLETKGDRPEPKLEAGC